MIADECKKLRAQLEEVAKAEERENVVEHLESRRTELLELREFVLSATSSLNALARRTEIVDNLDSSKSIQSVRNMREALRIDPLSMTKKQTLAGMTRALNSFANKGIAVAGATWDQYLPKAQPSVDTVRLTKAERLKGSVAIASRIKDRAKYARSLAQRPPANEEKLREIETIWEDIRQMMSELPDVADDPKVQEFLEAAESRSGASIDLLTEEVRVWLHKNNVAAKYRITTM